MHFHWFEVFDSRFPLDSMVLFSQKYYLGSKDLVDSFGEGLIPHSFQSSLFSKTSYFPCVSGGFLERRIPGKNGEGTPRVLVKAP